LLLCIAKPVFLLFIGVDGRHPGLYIEIFECYKKKCDYSFSR
jgi:hypothetical protein